MVQPSQRTPPSRHTQRPVNDNYPRPTCGGGVVAREWSGWSERKTQRRVDERRILFRMNFTGAARSHSLLDMLNVSVVLVEELRRVGIHSREDLEQATAFGAWHRLRAAGIQHETHVLFALAGAIQGIPWQNLPVPQRHELLRLAEGR